MPDCTTTTDPFTADPFRVSAVILAGGRATRMGGEDKGWAMLAGRPLAQHVIQRLGPQVDEILINANRSQDRYRALAPVIADASTAADKSTEFLGPLAGMQAGLAAAHHDWVLFVPCDGPVLPLDLMSRFRAAITPDTELVVAHDGHWLQPVVALLHRSLLPSLQNALAEGERKIDRWFARHQMAVVTFADQPDAFINLNTPAELAAYEERLLAQGAQKQGVVDGGERPDTLINLNTPVNELAAYEARLLTQDTGGSAP